MKRKIKFIINPKSGIHKKNDIPQLIEENIDADLFDFSIHHTEYAKHAKDIAKQCVLEGFDIVCAIGGDGSVHEVGTALIGTSTQLAIIPAGSGNGLARHLKIPLDLKQAIQALNTAQNKVVDTVLINDKPFLNVAGFGFDAHIAKAFNHYHQRGFWGYVKLVAREYFNFKPLDFTIEVNGQNRKENLLLCTVANASEFGNSFFISPDSDVSDGNIELCLLKPFPWFMIPVILYKFIKKKHHTSTRFEIIPFKKARVTLHKQLAHFDGEPFDTRQELNIEVIPLSLNVLVGKKIRL
jgi:diacylglycerol kinase (ATP)